MSDKVIYETSMMNTIESIPFVRKENVYVIDSNNNSYSGGSVIIDSSSFSNSGKFADYKSGFIQIPLVLRLEFNPSGTPGFNTASPSSIAAIESAMSLGLKNGSWQILQSMSIDLNNTNIVQLSSFVNQYITFKMLTQMSSDDLQKYGDSIGFQPDTGYGVRYNNDSGNHPEGHGSINNLNNAPQNSSSVSEDGYTYNDAYTKFGYNEGYKKRQSMTGFDPNSEFVNQFTSETQTAQMGQSYFKSGTIGQSDEYTKFWLCTLTLRLKDIASFFEEIPLARGLFFRFTLNLNLAQHTIKYVVNTTNTAYNLVDTSVVKSNLIGGTSPLMVASALPYNGMKELVTGVASNFIGLGGAGAVDTPFEYEIAMNVGRDNKYPVSCPWFTSCRLYVDLYQMAPSAEQQYISLNRAKQITYRDIYSFQIDLSNSSSGDDINTSFSQLLTNGLVNPKGLLLICYAGAASNPVSKTGTKLDAYQSPFAAEPSTPTPFIKLTNLQVQVGAQNVFQQNQVYSWENWLEETSRIYAVNGGQTTGMNSGLISYKDYITNYGYIYVDLERRLVGENSVPKSIQVSANCLSGKIQNVRIMAFVEFERTIAINPATGERLD